MSIPEGLKTLAEIANLIRVRQMTPELREATAAALLLLTQRMDDLRAIGQDSRTWHDDLGLACLMRVCVHFTMDPNLNQLSAVFARTVMHRHHIQATPDGLPPEVTPLMWLTDLIDAQPSIAEGETIH